MNKWQPINYRGAWHQDPRDELRARADHAGDSGDAYVAVPLNLAYACANLHECDATTVSSGDEDGPFIHGGPLILHCRKPDKHDHMHGNGYTNWA